MGGVHLNVQHSKTNAQTWTCEGTFDSTLPVEPTPLPSLPIIPDLDEGAVFLIQPAIDSSRGLCLAIRSDGYTKDDHEVYLAAVASDKTEQLWRLVRNCTFQHVASGRFLHSETKYAYVRDIKHPWEDNHTDLVTRPEDQSDAQRWVLGPEEFHGGMVFRHFRDGRGVDIHGWQMNDNNNVGCENSVHGPCNGISYVFTV